MRYAVLILALLFTGVGHGAISLGDLPFKVGAVCDYLVVAPADDDFLDALEPLIEYKIRKGLKTRVVTVDSIVSNYDGVDTPAKIRAFLQQAVPGWGVTWVLMAGDFTKVPGRQLFVTRALWVGDTQTVYSDAYFSCLGGDWDDNRDGIYGENPYDSTYDVECGIDDDGDYRCHARVRYTGAQLSPWVYIGRFPAATANELEILVGKTLRYSTQPTPVAARSGMLFYATAIGSYTIGSPGATYTADAAHFWRSSIRNVFRQGMSPFNETLADELYDERTNEEGDFVRGYTQVTASMLDSSLSQGHDMVFIAAHGISGGIYLTDTVQRDTHEAYTVEMAGVSVSPWPAHYLSISCSAMRASPGISKSLAKALLVNPDGGAVTYMGGSGTEYYREKTAHFIGATQLMVASGIRRICRAFMLSNADRSIQNNYISQFWGDPEIEVRARPVTEMDTFAVDVVLSNDTLLYVTVSPAENGVLICVADDKGMYERRFTHEGLAVVPVVNLGEFTLSATHADMLPAFVTLNGNNLKTGITGLGQARTFSRMRVQSTGRGISIAGLETGTPVLVRILSLDGRLGSHHVFTPQTNRSVQIPMASGMWLVQVKTEGAAATAKVLVGGY